MSYITLLLAENAGSQGMQWSTLAMVLGMFLVPLVICGIYAYRAHRRIMAKRNHS